jgi:hypothetical protein
VPPAYVPGQPVTIRLDVAPGLAVAAFAAEEQVPAGWTVSEISEGGEFDAVNQWVKWGPFLDGAARSLRYVLVAPATTPEVSRLRGWGSFDGCSQSVQGDERLVPAGWLEADLTAGAGAIGLRLVGEPGRDYVIEASTDLEDWIALGRVTAGDAPTPFVDSDAGQHAMRFYRVRPVTP